MSHNDSWTDIDPDQDSDDVLAPLGAVLISPDATQASQDQPAVAESDAGTADQTTAGDSAKDDGSAGTGDYPSDNPDDDARVAFDAGDAQTSSDTDDDGDAGGHQTTLTFQAQSAPVETVPAEPSEPADNSAFAATSPGGAGTGSVMPQPTGLAPAGSALPGTDAGAGIAAPDAAGPATFDGDAPQDGQSGGTFAALGGEAGTGTAKDGSNQAEMAQTYSSIASKFDQSIALLATGMSAEQANGLLASIPLDAGSGAAGGSLQVSSSSLSSQARVWEGRVRIEALSTDGDIEGLAQALKNLGLEDVSTFGNLLNGWLPVESIEAAAGIENLQYAYTPFAGTGVGVTTSQGDAAMQSDVVRTNLGLDGTGLKIGVLSDSFNTLGGEASGIAGGDLPGAGNPLGNTTPVTVLAELPFTGIDEGRAMIELIHDVVPKAELLFHTASNGQADFAQGILELVAAGADVITDDIFYFANPFFQDGIIAQAADEAFAAGVPYFAHAGNHSDNSYESIFRDSGIDISTVDARFTGALHDFDPGSGVDPFLKFTANGGMGVSFQWDEPFKSVTGTLGALSDYDIFILNEDATAVLIDGTSDNVVTGDPVHAGFVNLFGTFNVAFARKSGTTDNLLKFVAMNNGAAFDFLEFDTKSPTVTGHSNAAGAAAVGAAPYFRTPDFGVASPELEPFSSLSGVDILFDTEGNRLATPEERPGVQFVAPDNTNTTFFGTDRPEDTDSFPNFSGTSAAAPHAAAVAAQLLQLNPNATPHQIYDLLADTAIDITSVFNEADPTSPITRTGLGVGFDDYSGAGLIDASAATMDRVLITEIMYNPGSPEADWEWVEIYNNGFTTVDLSTWVFDNDDGLAVGSANLSGTLAPNESAVLFNAAALTEAEFRAAWGLIDKLIPVTTWNSHLLNNAGDRIGLWSSFSDY